ncbi:MAG: hypothetical protein ICV74_06195, partial [Thermoleophilia bacterium]|nr:hypothetical protein [Thermoleophilia bacterium]
GRGALVAQAGGVALAPRIQRLRDLLGQAGLAPSVVRDDGDVWSAQRSGQRSADGLVVRVSALPTALARVLRLADRLDAAVVGRAGLGLSWLRLPPRPELVGAVRRELAPSPCVVLDAPPELRARVDAWGPVPEGLRRLAARVKERFDPEGVCGPALP